MALLELKNIGKIYVSEGNVAVGIRGVDLSFDRGEFVAVTGKSGSGKSTLLNVISGMDSYEEGEMLIEGQTTSHYLQPDWEEYRREYISFIFQDYNIIESFTVLQNVELALMHIEDKRQRRARALELIERVGLTSHLRHKGSRLSGGQKQRTVIARALAKDSPIILADEPTGNLDSKTSQEIIALLREVSRDKLLIVVTHNFDQVAEHATRHIRIFDGAVEADHAVRPASRISAPAEKQPPTRRHEWRNGLTLGRSMFTSRPRLSLFLCLLMIVGTMGIFLSTSLCGDAAEMFEKNYMFRHIEGRVVVTTQSGAVIPKETATALAAELGAKSLLRHDLLLDDARNVVVSLPRGENERDRTHVVMNYTFGEDFGTPDIGCYPTGDNEAFLYLPIYLQPIFGKDSLLLQELRVTDGMLLKISGVSYYYDNNLTPRCLMTEVGFRTVTAMHYLQTLSGYNMTLTVYNEKGGVEYLNYLGQTALSFDMPADKVYVDSGDYYTCIDRLSKYGQAYTTAVELRAVYRNYDYNYYNAAESDRSLTFTHTFGDADLTREYPNMGKEELFEDASNDRLILSDEWLRQIVEEVLDLSYRQMSLFFEDDKAAHAAALVLQDAGYIAVVSDTTYEPAAADVIMGFLMCVMMAFIWVLSVLFLAFFVNLCSARALSAFKGDMAIMRSMGISVKVIRIGMYVRMLLSLIPAFALVAASAVLIFTTPKFNALFTYLYAWQYALIFLGMTLLTLRTTHKQIRRLFGESVKKSLKGGAAE